MSTTEPETGWELEIGGLRLPLSERPLVIGRDPGCDVPLEDERVSWRHARLELKDGKPVLTDLDSSNGTYVDGLLVNGETRTLTGEAIIRVGSTRARVREQEAERTTAGRFHRVSVRQTVVTIGRAPDNDIVLNEPNVSWHHAELARARRQCWSTVARATAFASGTSCCAASGRCHPE